MTTLYFTTVHELRSDVDRYMFSIDRCYTRVEQANQRLEVLAICNADPASREIRNTGIDSAHGTAWLTLAHDGSRKCRLFIEVRAVCMFGAVNQTGWQLDHAALARLKHGRWPGQARKDLVGHIWVVAVNRTARTPTVALDGRPAGMAWQVESAHAASGNALAGGKRIWKTELQRRHGPAEKVSAHYGLARWTFRPLFADVKEWGRMGVEHQTCAQIRVERVRVTPPDEVAEPFLPAEAIVFRKAWRSLCPGREDVYLARMVEEALDLLGDEREKDDNDELAKPERQRHIDSQRATPSSRQTRESVSSVSGEMARLLGSDNAEPPTPTRLDVLRQWPVGRDLVNAGLKLSKAMRREHDGLMMNWRSALVDEAGIREDRRRDSVMTSG